MGSPSPYNTAWRFQADGKIVAVGYAHLLVQRVDTPLAAVARYHMNGSLDNSFGSGGVCPH